MEEAVAEGGCEVGEVSRDVKIRFGELLGLFSSHSRVRCLLWLIAIVQKWK